MAAFLDPTIGQINQSGDPNAIFLKVFSGEVLTAFKLATIADELQTVRTISSGKSAQFPVTGWLQGHYHQPGTEILGQQGVQNEKIVTIDDLLIADFFIPNIEEAKAHFDIRSIYTGELGRAIARQYDQRVIIQHLLAARAAANLSAATVSAPVPPVVNQVTVGAGTGGVDGAGTAGNLFIQITYVTDAGETTGSTELTFALSAHSVAVITPPSPAANVIGYNVYVASTTGNEKLQSTSGPIPLTYTWTQPITALNTTSAVTPTSNTASGPTGASAGTQLTVANVDTDAPTLRTTLLNGLKVLDQNNVPQDGRFILLKPAQYWLLFQDTTFGFIGNQFFGGAGGLASGELPRIGGCPIRMSNNFPTGVRAAKVGENNTYSGTFTNTVAVVGHKATVGTVKLMDLAVEMEKSVRYQGTLSVARLALGTNILRPESSVEILHP